MKHCKTCNTTKSHTEFHKSNTGRTKDGLRYKCKECCKKSPYLQRIKLSSTCQVDGDKTIIKQLKKDVAELNKIYGRYTYSVGHIVPLRGIDEDGKHIVCGLNVPHNMEIERGKCNYGKGGRITLQQLNKK